MTLKKAIDRLSWRFGKCKVINPVQEDLDAYNTMLDYIQDSNKEQLSKNLLFAKLYIAVYKRTIEHYNTNILDPIPQKELHKFLDKPIEWHYENFCEFLNQEEWISSGDVDFNVVTSVWDLEDVTNNLKIQMGECLRKYSDH